MKTIFANGCSWTWGGALDYNDHDRFQKITWPAHLKKLFRYENVVNKAMGCGSNQRMVRTTFDWVTSQPKEILENTIAVIQWTDPFRYEYYVPDKKLFIDDNNIGWENNDTNWALVKVGVVLSSKELFQYTHEELVKRANNRLVTDTVVEAVYRNITYFETLSNLFKKYNVEYYFWDCSLPYVHLPKKLKSYILENYNWLEPEGRHRWEYDRVSVNDAHPNERGHEQLAYHIKAAIEKYNYYGKY